MVEINPAQYVWYNEQDTSRNPYAAFRKRFTLMNAGSVQQADFHIFADTVYQLYVNGLFIGFGPVRFDPRYPQYDTYDLSGYLLDGENTICVLVNFHGHKVFKSIPTQAAMIAWGEIIGADGTHRLHTGITDNTPWKCLQHTSYTRYTQKLSFALHAQTYYDQSGFNDAWLKPDYDDNAWPVAIPLRNQQLFGPLTPREIPFMALTPVQPAAVSILPLQKNERLFSFYIPCSWGCDTAFDIHVDYSRFLCWSTYVYSPCVQTVVAGVLYEKLWLNGEPCEDGGEDPTHPLRYHRVLALNEGWNYLFAQIDIYQDIYEGYLALPINKGLCIAADKDENSGLLFRYLQIQSMEQDAVLRALPLPLGEAFNADVFGGWAYATAADHAASPCRETAWDVYGSPLETLSMESGEMQTLTARKALYPDGFTLRYDMGHMRLVFPHIILRGVAGATIDLVYSDRLAADRQHLRFLSWVPLGDRLVCEQETLDWLPIQPRGFRYINITVRNASGNVSVDSIHFQSAQYPIKSVGWFECSDPLLNRIWEMGARTQAINMEDAYDDCVDRERGLYALDMLIQYHVNLACFGDHALMKRSLQLYGQSAHEIGLFRCLYPNTGHYILPDFALYIVNAFHAYYRYTGDTALIAEYWPAIMTNIRVFHRLSDERPDGLLCADPPAGDWPRKPEDNRTGFLGDWDAGKTNNKGINCLFTCLYIAALRDAEEMAHAVATRDGMAYAANDARDFSQRITALKTAVQNAFWHEEKGLFADNTEHETYSPHASLLAVKAGFTTPSQDARLRETLPPLLTPFFYNGYDPSDGYAFSTPYAFNLLDALYRLGLAETAERCIREGWLYFLHNGLTTTPEHFNLSNSQCHAWAASPTYMLSRYVLGIQFDAHNDEISINVQPGSLTWARGAFPHAKGAVHVEWHTQNGQVIIDRVSAPEGMKIRI